MLPWLQRAYHPEVPGLQDFFPLARVTADQEHGYLASSFDSGKYCGTLGGSSLGLKSQSPFLRCAEISQMPLE